MCGTRAPQPTGVHDDEDRAVAIVYTSGTTGVPKGATYCGRNIEAPLPTGELRWFDLQLSPLIDRTGTLVGSSASYVVCYSNQSSTKGDTTP